MKKIVIAALAFTPAFAFAQQLGNVEGLLRSIGRLIDIALPIVVAIALLVFFWGIVKMIMGGAKGVEDGKQMMIWGLVALFVMVSVWGIVRWIGVQLGVGQGDQITVPSVPLR